MSAEIPYGYCHCGCGMQTRIANRSAPRVGIVKGQPNNFIFGHGPRKSTDTSQYKNTGRGKGVHVRIAEQVLGKPLPKGAIVHHINGRKGDNSPGNYVICQNQGYHMLIHLRMKALRACGNPNWRKCVFCRTWDDPHNLKNYTLLDSNYQHAACVAAYNMRLWRQKKERENNVSEGN